MFWAFDLSSYPSCYLPIASSLSHDYGESHLCTSSHTMSSRTNKYTSMMSWRLHPPPAKYDLYILTFGHLHSPSPYVCMRLFVFLEKLLTFVCTYIVHVLVKLWSIRCLGSGHESQQHAKSSITRTDCLAHGSLGATSSLSGIVLSSSCRVCGWRGQRPQQPLMLLCPFVYYAFLWLVKEPPVRGIYL